MIDRNSCIPIVVSFTPNYIIPAATTISSILKHSKITDRFEIICLLTEELSATMHHTLMQWEPNRLEFTFINLEGKLDDIYIDERYTAAASFRVLLPNILPEYKSVIYLDCDIIVRNDLEFLYKNTSLDNNYLAAVYEATLEFQIPYVTKIGCQPGEYINSGFLIMNLEAMRRDNLVPDLINQMDNPNSSFPDQDALNIVCKGNILGLSPIYNSIRTCFLPQYKADFLKYYSELEWINIQKHGTIHYTGLKPWNGYTVEFGVWWEYYERLPEAIKRLYPINHKYRLLAKCLQYPIVNKGVSVLQSVYRKLK